jgi:hypothetical protein
MMPQNYLTSTVERDPNASAPVTNKLQYKRLATVKEGPGGGINPHNLKYTLDQVDAEVDARANNSQCSDNTSFPVTWTWLWCQNGDFKLKDDSSAAGMADKIVELRPPFHFVDKPADQLSPNERQVDPVYKNNSLYKDSQWVSELVFFSRCFYKLHDLNRNRTTHPLPPHSIDYRKASNVDVNVGSVRAWIVANLIACDKSDADPCSLIEKEIRKVPGVDGSVLTSAGLGTSAKVRRRQNRDGVVHSDYYFSISLKPGDVAKPVKLKPQDS